MQTLKLADKLFAGVDSGKKQGTIRAGKREIDIGELRLEAASGAECERVVSVKRVSYTEVGGLRDTDAALDGYGNVTELFRDLKRFYPNLAMDDLVTVIEFERLRS